MEAREVGVRGIAGGYEKLAANANRPMSFGIQETEDQTIRAGVKQMNARPILNVRTPDYIQPPDIPPRPLWSRPKGKQGVEKIPEEHVQDCYYGGDDDCAGEPFVEDGDSKSKIHRLKAASVKAQAKVEWVSTARDAKEDEVKVIKSEVDEVKRRLAISESNVEELQIELSSLYRRLNTAKVERDALEEELSRTKKRVRELEDELREAQNKLLHEQQQNERRATREEDHQQQLAGQQQNFQEERFRQELQVNRQSVEDLRRERDQERHLRRDSETENDRLRRQLAAQRQSASPSTFNDLRLPKSKSSSSSTKKHIERKPDGNGWKLALVSHVASCS